MGIEGIGLENIGSSLQIIPVDLANNIRPRETEQFVVTLHIAGPIREPCPAIIRLRQFAQLNLGSHGSVQHQDALGERLF